MFTCVFRRSLYMLVALFQSVLTKYKYYLEAIMWLFLFLLITFITSYFKLSSSIFMRQYFIKTSSSKELGAIRTECGRMVCGTKIWVVFFIWTRPTFKEVNLPPNPPFFKRCNRHFSNVANLLEQTAISATAFKTDLCKI